LTSTWSLARRQGGSERGGGIGAAPIQLATTAARGAGVDEPMAARPLNRGGMSVTAS